MHTLLVKMMIMLKVEKCSYIYKYICVLGVSLAIEVGSGTVKRTQNLYAHIQTFLSKHRWASGFKGRHVFSHSSDTGTAIRVNLHLHRHSPRRPSSVSVVYIFSSKVYS